MFTGIIEEIGHVERIVAKGETLTLRIRANKVTVGTALGDSIAVNGVCLTVTELSPHAFSADVMPETFRATSLGGLHQGSPVNLERAMRADGRFGGHIVSGHVDTTATITQIVQDQNSVRVTLQFPKVWSKYTLPKGSIALDGISLTLFHVGDGEVTVSLIPHTFKETSLGKKGTGATVNVEFDTIAKYVERLLSFKQEGNQNEQPQHQSNLSMAYLAEHGFTN
ncbi:MAG: riboflavin synthase [Bacilli bacterium]